MPPPAWATRKARATLRGGALALAVTVAVFVGVSQLPQSASSTGSSLGFAGPAAQRAFARDHTRREPIVYVLAGEPSPPSFASRALL